MTPPLYLDMGGGNSNVKFCMGMVFFSELSELHSHGFKKGSNLIENIDVGSRGVPESRRIN